MEHETKRGRGRPALPPGERRQQKNYRLSPNIIALVAGIAAVQEMTETDVIEEAIQEFAKRKGVELAGPDV